ncbi:hybrid sensor histidine kinase/response regulator [Nitrincola tibetensis]|uniref:histidine kinase n=1 Tax=Nitrincola tibetensis TaxID=2219697 RepID=A0A364NLX1_9GAMM|nr:hybrid sensor histidine kinase/response regulator [Nitrincola tibetensis]
MLKSLKFWRLDSPFQGLGVRSRLMIAFVILASSSTLLALVGWTGLSNTDTALKEFEQQALPNILQSLALAERTANLAAVAPYVANTSSPSMLSELNRSLEEKINQVLELSTQIPQLEEAAPNLQPLLNQLELTITELMGLTRAHLLLREDVRQYEYSLNQLRYELEKLGESEPVEPLSITLFVLFDQLNQALYLEDVQAIEALATTFSEQFFALRQDDVTRPLSTLLSELKALGIADSNLFRQRVEQVELQQRRAFLLASTRAISNQLSIQVKEFVDQVQQQITQQSQRMGLAVNSGKTGILMIALLCFTAALAGIWIVRELTESLGRVTAVMSRLAKGDTLLPTPAIERRDEMGELARAFEVFRENAVAIDTMRQDLQEQSHLLETIFNHINDGLSVFDQHNRLIAWNPQYAAMLELPEEELHKGMSIEEIYARLSVEAQEGWALNGIMLNRDEVNQLRQQSIQRFERNFPGGRVVEFRSNPMPEGGFVTLYSDLTERKAIEAQLRQSQKMEVLGQLTGGVAHDFNNLLAAMFGNLQLLGDHLSTDSQAAVYAHRALAAADRGRHLTQRLLAFSRKQYLQPEVVDVNALIEGMLDLIEYSVGDGITLELALDADPALVSVDPSQLENALLNLSINSSAAMQGCGQLCFQTTYEPQYMLNAERQAVIRICVRDTGCGIPDALIRRVFEPFFTTKEIGEGSGLGLSMVYGFVKQSQGDIQIRSHVGQGTEVDILLPCETALPNLSTTPDSASPLTLGQGQRILLVEDDPQVGQMSQDLLEGLGYGVVHVTGAEQALSVLQSEQNMALVFSDINLGSQWNGLALQQHLAHTYPELPVLLTSGLHPFLLQQRYGLTEEVAFIAKPYSRESLAAAITKLIVCDLKEPHEPTEY